MPPTRHPIETSTALHMEQDLGGKPRFSRSRACRRPIMMGLKTLRSMSSASKMKEPVRVAVTGAAGQIGYSLLFRIASGALLGPNQPIILHCIELPHAMNALKGVAMELDDCAFPLLHGIVQTDDLHAGFDSIDYALLVGSMPRKQGMERKDLLSANGKIFAPTGQALNAVAKKTTKVLVVGNPANTNCLIASANCPKIPATNFTAMTRLDHDRALAQVAQKTGCHTTDIERLCIWGNHSATQYPDVTHATIRGESAKNVINDQAWIESDFIPTVQQRGAAIINARGASSAASAANAAIAHTHDWALGTKDKWVSMAVPSKGEYGIDEGLFFSYPTTCSKGKYTIVEDLPINEFSAEKIEATRKELLEERNMVADLL